MKLLLDQNLSSSLVADLSDLFPESTHAKTIGMERSEDSVLWNYALENGLVIVSKDSDFQQRSILYGAPPKVIWLRVGNCPTSEIEKLIRSHSATLHTFEMNPDESLLILS